ncbi:MAG: hypothetical protein V4629_01690 [Pseudomonadota bacterium]
MQPSQPTTQPTIDYISSNTFLQNSLSVANLNSSLSNIQETQQPSSPISRPSTPPINYPSSTAIDAFSTPPPQSVIVPSNLYSVFKNKLGEEKANTISNFLEAQKELVIIGGSMAMLIHASRMNESLADKCRVPNDLDLIFTESPKQASMSIKYNAEGLGQGQYHVTSFSIGKDNSAFNIDLIDDNKIKELTRGNNNYKEIEYNKLAQKIYVLSLDYLLHEKQCALHSTEKFKYVHEKLSISNIKQDIIFMKELIALSSTKSSPGFN